MGNHRVLKYEATVYYKSTGSSHTKLYPFTQTQANEIGAVLETDGLSLEAAISLCDRWTRRGNHIDIKYSYRVPFTSIKSRVEDG